MRSVFIVIVRHPDTISTAEMKAYINDAVKTWKGSLDPEGELFNLNDRQFTVKNWMIP